MNNNKKAFTLAEILITLAIIGIVASLTIKNVIVDVQKQQTVVKLKKAYSTLYQAIYRSEVTNGSFTTWDFGITGDEFFTRYLNGFGSFQGQSASGRQIKYSELNGNALGLWIFQAPDRGTVFTLRDGTKVFMTSNSVNQNRVDIDIIFDINGDRGPNRMGKDLFFFDLNKRRGLIPFSRSDNEDASQFPIKTREELINGQSPQNYQCKKGKRGEWCAALIMVDGWKISDDYPW